jgi:hypothetical protein
MVALKDLTGQRFNKLTVIKRDESKAVVFWLCKCDCGNVTSIRASHLPKQQSCGCERLNKAVDITGQKFNRLTAIKRVDNYGTGTKSKAKWLCACDCGNETFAAVHSLKSGNTKSCGCLNIEIGIKNGKLKRRHGMTKTKPWITWDSMLQRCNNKKHKSYHQYGGRGITVCERWLTFENFFEDMGVQADGMTIERNDVNGNYEPSNCRWATILEQANNKRTNRFIEFKGERKTLKEWSISTGISRTTISDRIKYGWSIEDALTKPKRAHSRA